MYNCTMKNRLLLMKTKHTRREVEQELLFRKSLSPTRVKELELELLLCNETIKRRC